MSDLELDNKKNGIWQVSGTIDGERIRQSLRTRVEKQARERAALLEATIWKRHNHGEEAVHTFEEAAVKYMEQGGEGTYLEPIIRHFKGRSIGSIKPAEIRAMASAIYPKGAPATKNRQGIVPARAVIVHAHELGWCHPIKVRHFEVQKSRKHQPVDREWIEAFMAEADKSGLPHLSALVLFMHQTGTRVGEAIRIKGEHIDLGERTALLEETKTESWLTRHLTAELVIRMAGLGVVKGRRIFGYTDPKAVNRRIKAVAARAGIVVRSTHSVGRHSFATNAINGGAKIKDAMDAGGWKSAKLFMETYVHSTEGGKNVAAMFDKQTGPIGNNLSIPVKRRRATFGKR